MKKIIFTIAFIAATLFANAQTKQYFWLDGHLMLGTQIASTDSLTYGSEDTDSIMLYLPRTATRTVTVHDTIQYAVHDTVTVHDTIAEIVHDTVTEIVHDTITNIVHDTIYIAGNDTSSSAPVNSGLFSVSDNTQVQFSPGNLQYQDSTATWRFAENQYDYIGTDNSNIYSGWIDLFGWGTGFSPFKTSTSSADYSSFVDWGANAISNGGNVEGQWRTLTKDEWGYLFITRADAASLYGMGSVNGINGLILLPDDWIQPNDISFVNSSSSKSFTANTYTLTQWNTMEAAGAVFLPAAGHRNGTSVSNVGSYGYAWSSTADDSGASNAYFVVFSSGNLSPQSRNPRYYGFSVRLVR